MDYMNRELFFFFLGGELLKKSPGKKMETPKLSSINSSSVNGFFFHGRLPSLNGSIDALGRRFRLKTVFKEGGFFI